MISGNRLRICKLASDGRQVWNVPRRYLEDIAHLRHVIEYDERQSGRVYHVGGQLFTSWEQAKYEAMKG